MTAKQNIAKKYGKKSCNVLCASALRLALAGALALAPRFAHAQFAGGNGSESAPFQIATPQQLAQLHSYADGYHSFILINDLNLRGFDAGDRGGWLPIGNEKQNPFNGKFDGNGKTISNLTINRPDMAQVGLFGCLRRNAVVANLTLENVKVTGGEDVGALVGFAAQSSVVDNCHARSGMVEGKLSVGGLAGYLRTGSLVKNSSSSVIVRGLADYTGGLVGEVYAAGVENSTAKGTVYSAATGTGGLVGFMHMAATVRNSYSTSRVVDMADNLNNRDSRYSGGLVGSAFARSSVENSYASGVVSGTESVGGLIGWADREVHSHNNVALNTSVSGSSDVYAAHGRLEQSALHEHYTRADMVLKERGVTMHNPSSREAGINIVFAETKVPFYQSIGWFFGVDERNPWIFNDATNLPMLWFEGTPASSISLNSNMITLYPGDVYELLAATVEPSNARLKLVQWRSTAPGVATVSEAGVVRAVSLGATDVLARTVDGGFEAVCRVNVIPRAPLGVAQNEMRVSVYPNPVRERLNVEASEEIRSIAVYSAAGVLLLERRDLGAATAVLDVAQLPSGVHVLVVRSRSGMHSLKFVVF